MTRPTGKGKCTGRHIVMRARHGTILVAGCGALFASLVVVACGGAATPPLAGTDTAKVTWLCRPGLAGDPCLYPRSANSVAAGGAKTVVPATTATAQSAFDCFYVYPTVTASAATSNAAAAVTPEVEGAAVSQASRFSQVCNVWAPTYRQRTSASLAKGLGDDPAADEISYQSLLEGWKAYLADDNHGRPVVFIGHSQGAANLIRLLRSQVDDDPALRGRMVSAIILGGNVQVPVGKTVGGTFSHIPACTKVTETGCVIAYSSFSSQPPADSLFGRPGQGVSLQSDQKATRGQQVVCTNPAALGHTTAAPLTPFFVSSASSTGEPWVTYPGLYTGACESAGGATWLQIDSRAGDTRPIVTPTLGPTWGLHLDDVNLALGDLVNDVAAQEAAYSAHHATG
ncbi:MAG: DUF3089 domain-containing protein [Acidimicrobiales bacterium]